MRLIVLTVLSLAWISFSVHFTKDAAAQAYSTIAVKSEVYSDPRPILVHLPEGYENETRRYPVLYVLNSEENFHWASEIVDFLTAREEVDEMLVVGLPDQGSYGEDNYPFVSSESPEPSPDALRYADFLRNEVIPLVDRSFRTEDSRLVAGHSLSGLFVMELFRTTADEFNVYIIISPSLHHAPQMVDLVSSKLDVTNKAGAVYMTIGNLEHDLIQGQFARLREAFETHAKSKLIWAVDQIPYNNHRSAAYAGLYSGLSWVYRGWGTSTSMVRDLDGVEGIVGHYDALSEMLGYSLGPAEGDLAGLAGFLCGQLHDREGAKIAYTAELHYFPASEEARTGLQSVQAVQSCE